MAGRELASHDRSSTTAWSATLRQWTVTAGEVVDDGLVYRAPTVDGTAVETAGATTRPHTPRPVACTYVHKHRLNSIMVSIRCIPTHPGKLRYGPLERRWAVSYTHLTLPTNREV